MDILFARCWEHAKRGLERDYVTGNNDADGVYFLHWARREVEISMKSIFEGSLPNGAATAPASTSPTSTTSATSIDTMWWDCARQRALAPVLGDLGDTRHPIMAGLARPRTIRAAAAPAPISTSAVAIPACGR